MTHPFARFGVYYSLLYITVNLIFYLTHPALLFDVYAGWMWMVLLVFFMWAAIREKKNSDNGFISMRGGVKQAWLTFVIGLGASYIFQYLLANFIDTGLLEIQKDVQIEAVEKMARSMGLSEDKIQSQIEEIRERGHADISRTLFGYASLLVFGAIPSFLLAALMKKSPENTTA